MILGLIEEARAEGAGLDRICRELDLDVRTIQRWKASSGRGDGRRGPLTRPGNSLTSDEKAQVLRIVNSPCYRDLSPKQIVPLLAEQGTYIASESTIYRLLRERDQVHRRDGARAPRPHRKPRELKATGPGQVWSWDITYLKAPIRGDFLYLYMVMDVWSRKVVGWRVETRESSELAGLLISACCRHEGISEGDLTIHSDNGGPMRGATLLATLQGLGVATSFSRPSVSNDNPFSESLFRTMKYAPAFPSGRFESLEAAIEWVGNFVGWYNEEHRHSSIGFVTPSQRHAGEDVEVLEFRKEVYAMAKARTPERWSGPTRRWDRPATTHLNPDPEATATTVA